MLGWLNRFLHSIGSHLPSPVRDAINWSVSAIGGLFGTITNDVAGAWKELTSGFDALQHTIETWTSGEWSKLKEIVEHWIPQYAITAWWWVTNPGQFAQLLLYHLVAALEKYALTVAKYLGQFTLALITKQLPALLKIAEQVLAAIL